MPKYLSGRVKRTPQNRLSDDRYQYLGLDQAEPNMGDPPTASGTPDIPVGQQYQLVSVLSNPGERYWKPVGGGLIPGSISVFDEGSLVGTLNSITQLDFRGLGIGVSALPLGIAATITVSPPGNNGSVLYKDSDDFATSSDLVFNSTVGILTVGKGLEVGNTGLKVGVGGTFLTVSPETGYVGILTAAPTQELDVNGDARLRGTIYDFNNDAGAQGNILTKGASGVEWTSDNSVRSGAGGTIYDVQYHNTAGLVDGAPNFVYRSDTSRVGIGSTQPTCLLDIDGVSKLRGGVNINEPYITGVSTFTGQILANTGIVANTARIEDLTNLGGIVFTASSGELVDDVNFTYTIGTDTLNLINLSVNGTAGISSLNVSGISTLGSVEVGLNTITTTTGALVLNASSGIVQSDAGIFISVDTESTNKDTGALTVDGGVGIEKDLNVGGQLSVGGATTLASAGGITTTGGDLYVGNDLYIKGDLSLEQGTFQKLLVTGISTFKGDVEFWGDTNTGAAKSAYWDKSTGSFNFINTSKLYFGNNQELTIYHNGFDGNSYIEESHSTGNLYIKSSDIYFQNTDASKTYAVFNDNADSKNVDLYHDNSIKFSTVSTGATVYGEIEAQSGKISGSLTVDETSNLNGDVNLGNAVTDNVVFGGKVNSNIIPNSDSNFDLGSSTIRWSTIYADTFDGLSNLTVEDLFVTGIATFKNDVEFWGNTGIAKSAYWDKSDNSFNFIDNAQLKFGDSQDLSIYHDSSSSYLKNTTNGLYLDSPHVYIRTDGGADMAHFNGSTSVDLFFNNSKRFETFDKGIGVYGDGSSVGGGVSFYNSGNTYNTKIKALDGLAASYTLTLPPDDGDSGDLLLTDGSGNLDWIPQSSVQAQPGGSDTELQYNDGGSFGGIPKLTYNDSNSNLSLIGNNVGVTSAYWNSSSNEFIFNDNAYLKFGTDEDLEIYHSGSHSIIRQINAGTGDLYIDAQGSKSVLIRSGDGGSEAEDAVICNANASVEIYHSGTKKFETTGAGVTVYGGIYDKDGELGTIGQVLASTGTELNWVDAGAGSVIEIDVKQNSYCEVDNSPLNPITVTPTSSGITTVSIGSSSNAYGRRFVQATDPDSGNGGDYTICNGDIWYDTSV